MQTSRSLDIHDIKMSIMIVISVIVGAVVMTWQTRSAIAEYTEASDRKFTQIKIETNQALAAQKAEQNARMARTERLVEGLALSVEDVKKNALVDSQISQQRSAGRWTRGQQYILCERHASRQQKINGMCLDILSMPLMAFSGQEVASWVPRYETETQ